MGLARRRFALSPFLILRRFYPYYRFTLTRKRFNLATMNASRICTFLLIWLIWLFLTPIFARAEQYDLSVADLLYGRLNVDHQFSAGKYSVDFEFVTTGLAAILFDDYIKGEATGLGAKFGAYSPGASEYVYRLNKSDGYRKINYKDGAISSLLSDPVEDTKSDPVELSGTIDPVTALGLVFRERSLNTLCKLRVPVFDGRRLSYLVLQSPKKRFDGRMECTGAIEVMRGFSENNLLVREPVFFNVIFRYDDHKKTYSVDRIIGQTVLGTFMFTRLWGL